MSFVTTVTGRTIIQKRKKKKGFSMLTTIRGKINRIDGENMLNPNYLHCALNL